MVSQLMHKILSELYFHLHSIQLPCRPSRPEVRTHLMSFLLSLTCSKPLRKTEPTDGTLCSSEQWWLTVEITQAVCSVMLWKYDTANR